MVNEWVKVDADDRPTRKYTIADGTSVSKGQLLELADPRTVSAAKRGSYIAGVSSEEHIAGQGITNIGVIATACLNLYVLAAICLTIASTTSALNPATPLDKG